MEDIFRIKDAKYAGVNKRYIDGMRIFDENEVEGMAYDHVLSCNG